MNIKGFGFLVGWTAFASIAAWLCFNRLVAAKEAGQFRYMFHGVSEEGSPRLFQFCKAFITVQAYGFFFMAGVGMIWFVVAIIRKLT